MQPELATQHWSFTNTPPLWPLEFFCVALNARMATLHDDCDAGRFGHVWDISCGERKNRRELRVFYRDGLAVLNRQRLPRLTYEDCIEDFLPRSRGLKGTEIQKLFCCGPNLVHDLDAAGLLAVERDRPAASGPRASRLYSRSSILNFLTIRALALDPSRN
jgi:hypothetical protein